MADSDKLLGVRIKDGNTTRVTSAYRIDYDSTDSVFELAGKEPDDYNGAVKNPPAGYSGHEAKTNYQRKVLVEDATTRDEVEGDLADAGVSYETEDVSPTQDEQDALDEFGAMNGLEGADAMAWKRGVEALSAGNITQEEFERGRNPHDGEQFSRPRSKGRGRGN